MKIRGHRRKWKMIEDCVQSNLILNMSEIQEYKRGHFAYNIYPWGGSTISMNPDKFKQPYGMTKTKMIEGFITIYDSWKEQLEGLNEPYYLKMWICEPNFSNSRVVYGIGSCIDGFERDILIDSEKPLELTNYSHQARIQLLKFDWSTHVEEEVMELDSIDIDKGCVKNHITRNGEYVDEDGEVKELLYFRKGVVWKGNSEKKAYYIFTKNNN